MDYNATTPLEPEVMEAMTEAMRDAWGNPSSPYPAGRKAKDIISAARESLAKMVGGEARDVIFTSGGTESNNLVIHSAVEHFRKTHASVGDAAEHHSPVAGALPHCVTCLVEHDSIRLPLEHLVEEQVAEVTFVPVSKVSGQVEADDVLAAVRPATCLVSIMLANNETGVVMPVPEISRRIRALNQQRAARGLPGALMHTDAAQALGKRHVDVRDLGVDFLTIVGHKAAELVAENCEAYEAHMRDVRDYLEERLAVRTGGQPGEQAARGREERCRSVLAQCRTLLASVGAACHSDHGDRPSPVLLSCGVPFEVARNAIRLSVGRGTTRAEVDLVVRDLKQAVARLEGQA
ncbi:selenocysteine lyase [Camelus ferus]|nr:selenocysteine lyase [Camelus ferus]